MTEPLIEEAEVETEEFTDELSDEALDRGDTAVSLATMCWAS